MPNELDVFKSDAFGVVEMSKAIEILPHTPTMLGDLGIFAEEFHTVPTCTLERQTEAIHLIPSTRRGAPGYKPPINARDIRPVSIPHFVLEDEVQADDVLGVRPFGKQADTLETVANRVNQKLAAHRKAHDLTLEYLRIGAIKGVILDGDASTTLINLFTEFNVIQKVVDFVLGTTTTDVKAKAMEVYEHMQDALGGLTFTGIRALCGKTFWSKLISHTAVKSAHELLGDNAWARENQTVKGEFEFCDITWTRYRGKVGTTSFIPDADCRFIAEGVPDLFQSHFAPANYVETVNTVAQRFYAKQVPKKFDTGIELQSQSNVITFCTRPNTLVRGHSSN